jgi:hypothetical protein
MPKGRILGCPAGLEAAVRRSSIDDVHSALGELGLSEVAEGRRELQAVRHPLGFACLPLQRQGDDGICIHVFPAGPRPHLTTSPVHCHSWNLLSFVLYGGVVHERFDVVDTAAGPWQVFAVRSDRGKDEISPTGRLVAVHAAGTTLCRMGEFYDLPAGVFHTSSVRTGCDAATVVIGRNRPDVANLTLAPRDVQTHVIDRGLYSEEATAALARQVIKRLSVAEGRSPYRPGIDLETRVLRAGAGPRRSATRPSLETPGPGDGIPTIGRSAAASPRNLT